MSQTKLPTRNQVLTALEASKGLKKASGVLMQLVAGVPCYCIEGVFCQVASELGYPGRFVGNPDDRSLHSFKLDSISDPGSTGMAPGSVFDFLGLPRKVPPEKVLKKHLVLLHRVLLVNYVGVPIEWSILNDYSSYSLDQLINTAIDYLSSKKPSSQQQ